MPRLKKDIGKFTDHSTVFEEDHRQWWDNFLNRRVPFLFAEKDRPTRWLLDDIVEMKQGQRTACTIQAEEGERHGLAAIPRPPDMPAVVNTLVDGQVDAVPEVSLF